MQSQLGQAQKMESVGRLAGGVAHGFNNMLCVILGHAEMALAEIDREHPLFDSLQAIKSSAQRSADLTRQLLAFSRQQPISPMEMDLNQSIEGMLGHETILLVEDEPAIMDVTKLMLEEFGYIVLATSSPGDALRLAEAHTGRISLLITDVIMPKMNGRQLSKALLARDPHLKCLFMSGYTANIIAQHGMLDPGVRFIQKPFSMRELSAKIRDILDLQPS